MRNLSDPLTPSTRKYVSSAYIARTYDYYFRDNELFQFDTAVLDEVIPPGSRILDLGCGTGRHTAHFSSKGCFAVGVDLSEHMLTICSAKLRRSALKGYLVRADICDLGFFRPGSFDAALCMFSTIGLIKGERNREQFLIGARRTLRPAGILVLHTHNFYHGFADPSAKLFPLTSALSALLQRSELGDKNLTYYRGVPDMYLHVFRDTEVKRLLKRTGFRVQDIFYLNDRRNAALRPSLPNRFRANGFIFVARAV